MSSVNLFSDRRSMIEKMTWIFKMTALWIQAVSIIYSNKQRDKWRYRPGPVLINSGSFWKSVNMRLKDTWLYVFYCSKYSRPAGPWVKQYKIQKQCLMTRKLNEQAELSMVSNAIQSKAHRNTKSILVQHSDVDPLLARHIKANSRQGSHRASHKLWNI